MAARRDVQNTVRRPKAGRTINVEEVAAVLARDPKEAARMACAMIQELPATHNEVRRLLPLWAAAVTQIVVPEPKKTVKKEAE